MDIDLKYMVYVTNVVKTLSKSLKLHHKKFMYSFGRM